MFRVFHQIEVSLFYNGDFSNIQGTPAATSEVIEEVGKHGHTNFILANEIILGGKTGAVRLLFNFYVCHRYAEEWVNPAGKDSKKGFLSPDKDKMKNQFSCVLDSLTDLGPDD